MFVFVFLQTANRFFGEIALLRDDCRRTANCVSDDPNGTILMCLHKIQFDRLILEESTIDITSELHAREEITRLGMLLDDGCGSLQSAPAGRHVSNETGDTTVRISQMKKIVDDAVEADHVLQAMEDVIQKSVIARFDTPIGADDYLCFAGVASRLRVPTMARRMPLILSNIPFDDPSRSTKLDLAVIIRKILKIEPNNRTDAQICFLMCMLKETAFFQKYGSQFSPNHVTKLCRALTYKVIRKSTALYKLGDRGSTIQIVLSGGLESHSRLSGGKSGSIASQESFIKKTLIKSGNAAGVVALQGVRIRIDTVVAKISTELMIIDSKDWFHARNVGNGSSLKKRLLVLSHCPLFQNCTHDFLVQLCFVCQEMVYGKNSKIVQRNDMLKGLYIVSHGEVGLSMFDSSKTDVERKSKKSKQLCKEINLTPSALFGLHGLFDKNSVNSDGDIKFIKSNINVTSLTQASHILLLPFEEAHYMLRQDRRFDIISIATELYDSRWQQFKELSNTRRAQATQHFVPADDTKWLEMSRSKRVDVRPPPIVECVLQKASNSVVANVVKSVQNSNTATSSPLAKLSAATAVKHSRKKQARERRSGSANSNSNFKADDDGDDNDLIFDTHTKIFNRKLNLGQVRMHKIYKKKRSNRYDLARDDRWLQRSAALEATCAQDPLLPFVATSSAWIGNPGTALQIAAEATASSHRGEVQKKGNPAGQDEDINKKTRQASPEFLLQSTHNNDQNNSKSPDNETHLRKNNRKQHRESQKKLIKQLLLPPAAGTPTRPSADQPLALPPDSKGVSAIHVRIITSKSPETVNKTMSINTATEETMGREHQVEPSDAMLQQPPRSLLEDEEGGVEESWDWMNQVAVAVDIPSTAAAMISTSIHVSTSDYTPDTISDGKQQEQKMQLGQQECQKNQDEKKDFAPCRSTTNTRYTTKQKSQKNRQEKRKKKPKKSKGTSLNIQQADTGLDSPTQTPPTGYFFPPPKLDAGKHRARLQQLKKQQFLSNRYV